jgi:putative DNA primase/helicase
VEAERKFQPSFSYQPYVRIVATTNILPYLKDTSDGFFCRAIILELTRKFAESEMDKHLQEKILCELDGILVLAVRALMRLLKRDEFVIPESAIKTANKYRDESDSVRYFVKESCTEDKKGSKPAALYEQYQRFAARFRFPALKLIKFGKQLTALGVESREYADIACPPRGESVSPRECSSPMSSRAHCATFSSGSKNDLVTSS